MGAFINEVVKNNHLQQQQLTIAQQKERERKEKDFENKQKDFQKTLKNEVLQTLDFEILQYYKNYGSISYNILNKYDERNELINKIQNIFYKMTKSSNNRAFIDSILNENYLKINKKYYNIFKLSEKSYILEQEEKEKIKIESRQKEEERKQKINNIFLTTINIIFKIFITIIVCICGLLSGAIAGSSRRKGRKRK